MRYTSINNTEELVLSPLLVKHYAVGDINDLNDCFAFERAALDLDISFSTAVLAVIDD